MDLRSPIIELGLQLPTLAKWEGQGKVTPDVGGAVLPGTPTQHLLRTRENLNEIRDYSIIAHSHTRTQRPQMTSERVIWPLLFLK